MVSPVRALVVDDEQDLVTVVAGYLRQAGYEVRTASDGEEALHAAREFAPDLVVLDLMMPGLGGIEVCRRLRTFSDAYVVMLTARDEEIDKVIGLSVGADDYLTKPFSPRELVARVQAMLRRPRTGASTVQRPRVFGQLSIDPAAREVFVAGRLVELTRTEFDILEALSRHPRAVLSRRQIVEAVWGEDYFGDEHIVDVHVAHLRRKLGDDASEPRFVRTVRGVGYRMGTG